MRSGSRAWTAARLILAAFCWLTALYGFVASSPFAYQQFIRPRVFQWLGAFSEWHAAACWVWLALAAAVVWEDVAERSGVRFLSAVFLGSAAGLVGWNTLRPIVPSLVDGDRSIGAGIIALVPVVWLAVIDHVQSTDFLRRQTKFANETHEPERPGHEPERLGSEGRLFTAAVASAVYLTGLYAVWTSISLADAFEPDLLMRGLLVGLGRSFVGHLLIMLSAFLLVAVMGRVVGRRFLLHYATLLGAIVALFGVLFARLIGASIGLDGVTGSAAAVMMAASGALTWSGLRVRKLNAERTPVVSAFDVYFGRARGGEIDLAACLPVAAVVPIAYGLAAAAGRFDWDFVGLKCGVIVVWVAAFATIYRLTPLNAKVKGGTIALVCLAPLLAQAALDVGAVEQHILERYAVYNPSFRVADAALRPTPPSPAFDRYLRSNTGFTDVAVEPVSIDFVPGLMPATVEPKPFIFLFVIDSLRPDYLGPYNPRVTFTPRIAQFATENLVLKNAFTRYGGTGLSMPAIWAGSALLHKQYVQPFGPMNGLDKLLEVNGYRKWLSRDHITAELLGSGASFDELDRGRGEMEFDFCATLGEIEGRLQEAVASARPIFAHTRSLNLHVARVRGGSVPAGESYPGFEAAYASRVYQMDACFGAFVDTLKRRGLYDRSLVILTSDHGEHLGEDGKWGHSYFMTPEVIQIPLLVHLPASSAGRRADPEAISFSTDITPTIYAALGYRPAAANPFMGSPLIGADPEVDSERRRGSFVLAASYGAVYAVVRRNGHRLYIADAINGGDHVYERGAGGHWAEGAMTDGIRMVNQLQIRRHIDALAELYHLQ